MATAVQQPQPQGLPGGAMPLPSAETEAAQAEGQEQQSPYGENNENLPVELQSLLKNLARDFCDEDKFSRRIEIQTSRKAHFFWRTLQHICWDSRAEGWVALGPNGAPLVEGAGRQAYNKDSAALYCTNIYKPFGLTLISVLTQSIPGVVAVPDDAEDPADIATAQAGKRISKIVEHKNDATMLLTRSMFFAYVDGRVHAWTRNELNKKTGKQETRITIHGSLECKVPLVTECMEEQVYLQFSHEQHVAIAKSENPKFKSKIKGGAQGAGQDVYERTARISVSQGTSYMSGSGDTLTNLATVQHTWMVPAAFEMLDQGENDDDPKVAQLRELFPSGCHLKIVSGEYVGSWDEVKDGHWRVLNAEPGDGQFRNSMGHTTESVQERFNDIINIAQETYEKTIPATWQDSAMVDQDGIFRQEAKPGAHYPVVKRSNEPISENFYVEPPASVSADMLQYGNDLMGPVGQLTSGAFTALQGGGEAKGAAGDTAAGYAMQREQAMGRIGLVYRGLKRWWADIMGQAVKCCALLQADMSLSIPDAAGNVETTTVRLEELQGDVHWYPETDEGIPINWSSKSQRYMALMTAADANPLLAKILSDPRNQQVGQDLIGLDDLENPAGEAWAKQMIEINEMLKGPGPSAIPNPALPQLQAQLKAMMQHSAAGGLHPDGAIEQLEMQLKSAPSTIQVSSIPIDGECDFNAEEWETVQIFMTTPRGLKEKAQNPKGFADVRLHGLAHKQAAQADAMAAAPPPPMPHHAPPPHGKPAGAPPAAVAA